MPATPPTSRRRLVPAQFLGFILAGGVATLVNYTLFSLLLRMGVHYLAASASGYLSGVLISFFINRRAIFRTSHSPLGPQLLRYLGAYGLALVVQLALLELLVRLGAAAMIANAVALVVVVVVNYFVVRRFVFGMAARRVSPITPPEAKNEGRT